MAAITGNHPYRTAIDVQLEKRGEAPPFDENERTRWGNLLEVPIRADYAERHGVHIEVPGTLQHPKHPWQIATPDGIVYAQPGGPPDRGLEIKCHTIYEAWRYGEPNTDEVPMHELVQCVWNMQVTGLDRWDLVAFIDGQPRDYTLLRDQEFVELLVDAGARFMRDHVEGDLPVPPDGSKAYSEHLARRWAAHGDKLVQISELDTQVAAFRDLVALHALATRNVERAKQELKDRIGADAGLTWTEGGKLQKLTWKRCADGSRVDSAGALVDVCNYAALNLGSLGPLIAECIDPDGATYAQYTQLIQQLVSTLTAVADRQRHVRARTSPVSGSRRFVMPRGWKAAAGDKED